MNWISPKHSLPQEGQKVAWLDSSGQESEGIYVRGLWFMGEIYTYFTPVFWRPLTQEK